MQMLGKILIVDDEEDFLSSMKIILVNAGYDVVCAGTGMRALTLVEEEKPDLILTDIVMPDLSGLQLAQSIRQTKGRHIPIISITGYPFRDEIPLSSDDQRLIDISLTKPLQIADLLSALTICLESR
ncbi:MAG: response regulator [Proteobacteria bacterium]|nr:MAG: response regulator [Pseudomonadota bacterium]